MQTHARDERGRPIHVMGSEAPQQSMRSGAEVLNDMWVQDQIDRPLWVQMQSAALTALIGVMPEDATPTDLVREASATADQMYIEYWRRSNGQV